MTLFDVGRVCVKIAGRDAGKKCVVVDVVDSAYVLVDGETRRKKVNTKHLEPLAEIIDVQAGASHDAIKSAFKKLGLEVADHKSRAANAKPVKQKKQSANVSDKKAKPKAKKAEKPKKTATPKQ